MGKYLDLQGLTTYDQAIKQYIDNSTPESITSAEIEELFNNRVITIVSANYGAGAQIANTAWPAAGEQKKVNSDTIGVRLTPADLDTSLISIKKDGVQLNVLSGEWAVSDGSLLSPTFAISLGDGDMVLSYNGEQFGGIVRQQA